MESDGKKDDFLQQIRNGRYHEEIEVSKSAITIAKEKYDIYEGWLISEYKQHRKQSTQPGCYLYLKEDKFSINIGGDILTGKSCFKNVPDDNYLKKIFTDHVYYSIGNILPMGEGGNLGTGGPNTYTEYGTLDHFSRKISIIYDCFLPKKMKYDNNVVKKKIEQNKTLGRGSKRNIYYWISTVYARKSWREFIVKNYLYDMVDENYNVLPFIKENMDATLEQVIKLIIQRSYRIFNNIQEELKDNEMIEISNKFKEFGLSSDLIYSSKTYYNEK